MTIRSKFTNTREKVAAVKTAAAEKVYSPWSRILGAVLARGATTIHMRRDTLTDLNWHRVLTPPDTGKAYTQSIRVVNHSAVAANILDVAFSKQEPDIYFESIPDSDRREYRLGKNGIYLWLRAQAQPIEYNVIVVSY